MADRLIKPSFSKGEISPALYGRVDTAAYDVALRTARNMNIHPYGGISFRDGMQFIGPVKTHSDTPRLIPFSFKTTDQYILEFGDQYMRVIRNDSIVLNSSSTATITNVTAASPAVVSSALHGYSDGDEVVISGVVGMTELNGRHFIVANSAANSYELTDQVDGTNVDTSGFTAYTSGGTTQTVFSLTTPYAVADVFNLVFVQSADVLTVTHKTYGIRDITRTADDAWTISEPSFIPEQDNPTAMAVTVNTTRTVTHRYTVTAFNDETAEESLM